jgi:GNAT superfamily N-acetyltransferase
MNINIEPPQATDATIVSQFSPSVVRQAEADEMEDLIELMMEAGKEQALFPVDEGKARAMLNRAFLREGGVVGVIGPKGAIEAAIYLILAQPLYSEDWHIEEVFHVVRPAFRRSPHAKALLEFSKKCHHDLGIPVLIGVLHQKRTEAKIRLYRRQFGPAVGAYFLYGVPGYGLTPSDDKGPA